MPEMTFTVRWPDGQEEPCYSPSLVMHDYLVEGGRYTVAEFRQRSGEALAVASRRVQEKFGFACSSAAATVEQIDRAALRFDPAELVAVTAMTPALPISQESP